VSEGQIVAELPVVIGTYLQLASAPQASDAGAIADCFTDDAELVDEGRTRRGRAAIREWWQGPATAFEYTVDVRSKRALPDDQYVVFTTLTGNFPGGTADLANRFTVGEGLIARLEIAPPRDGEESDGVPAQ
jgi:ketosteroid isomerase-like protein